MKERRIGSITLDYVIKESGRIAVDFTLDGDIDLITQLGILRLAEDSAIRLSMADQSDDE